MSEIIALDYQALPPELMLDKYHPSADEYIKKAQQVQRQIVSTSALMKPKQVTAVKMAYKGMSNVEIAAELKVNSQTVGTWLRSVSGRKLRALLIYYQASLEGPNEAQRLNMLWRISVDNEEEQPKISVSAIGEMNKMTMTDYDRKKEGSTNVAQTIIINNQLTRTALDD